MREELNLDELENVNASPNNEANYENTIKNKELYRKQQIEELEELKSHLLNNTEDKKNTR